ncbi:hypothetical protein [Polaromonas sp. AET17H-212]|uniref:hypothetical protein n=1 Tax=Polaromonas sp. AET17H-212 TaxID=1977061 RepID=UPI001142E2AC|nr:hypothetical protein [Polaromonas sp. AET17H-212]
MLFEMLAGRRPFIAESLELLLARHLRADTPMLPAAHRQQTDGENPRPPLRIGRRPARGFRAGELKAPSSGVNN